MKNLNKLVAAIGILAGSQSVYALTPWDNGAADLTIYTSGGAAQDQAIATVVSSTLAAPGSLDTFSDATSLTSTPGGRWQAFYFTGSDKLPPELIGKKIILEKRSYGAAGYGVVPLIANNGDGIAIEHLNIGNAPNVADWLSDGTKKWKQIINNTNANTYLSHVVSDGGFLGVDPDVLLKPATENYPGQVPEVSSQAVETTWPQDLNKTPNIFTVVNTGGLVYGIAVTEDLYRVLQAAQKRSGSLPSSINVGEYGDAAIPSLSRNFLASLLAGKVQTWDQVKIVDKTTGTAVPLNDASILADANVNAPSRPVVGVGRRNQGAAIGAVAYAKLLNYPGTARANPPATDTAAADDGTAAPLVKSPGGASASDSLLIDWASGTNVSGLNPNSQKVWGIAINSGDRDPGATADGVTRGKPWRYVKIDGYAPTIENVAAGAYPLWAEGAVLYLTDKPSDSQWADKKALLKAFADDLGSPAVAKTVNKAKTFGVSGIFATTKDPRGFKASIPFDPANPVVPLTHNCVGSSNSSTSIVPVADSSATGGLQLQLK
jgi:hypothetical protein